MCMNHWITVMVLQLVSIQQWHNDTKYLDLELVRIFQYQFGDSSIYYKDGDSSFLNQYWKMNTCTCSKIILHNITIVVFCKASWIAICVTADTVGWSGQSTICFGTGKLHFVKFFLSIYNKFKIGSNYFFGH